MSNPTNTNNKPVAEVIDTANGSRFKIAIFKHPLPEDQGFTFSGKTSFSYLDRKENIWKETKSISGTDYLRISQLALDAYRAEQQLRAEVREDNKPASV